MYAAFLFGAADLLQNVDWQALNLGELGNTVMHVMHFRYFQVVRTMDTYSVGGIAWSARSSIAHFLNKCIETVVVRQGPQMLLSPPALVCRWEQR
jgi:hypothetical protein